MNPKKYKEIVYTIIGAAMEVHNELGWGLLEPIYNEALSLELHKQGVDNDPERQLNCYYKGQQLKKFYKMDLVVGDVVVELKSAKELIPEYRYQLFNYLRLTKKPIGLLINFGEEKLHGERYAYFEENNECILINKNMEPFYPEDYDKIKQYLDDD